MELSHRWLAPLIQFCLLQPQSSAISGLTSFGHPFGKTLDPHLNTYRNLPTITISGGSKGGTRGSKFFHFHAVFGHKIGEHTHFGSWRPPQENPGSTTDNNVIADTRVGESYIYTQNYQSRIIIAILSHDAHVPERALK